MKRLFERIVVGDASPSSDALWIDTKQDPPVFKMSFDGTNWIELNVGSGDSDPDYLKMCFTVEALESGEISWCLYDKTLQYSKNGEEWMTMNSETVISVVQGDMIEFKGANTDYNNCNIQSTARFNVMGNIMSLTNADDFVNADIVANYAFFSLFSYCANLVSAENLVLPATQLSTDCYSSMFINCSNLIIPPRILPATMVAAYCYNQMFKNCESLIQAPVLPATTLGAQCYSSMFANCTSLTKAPDLPATTLANRCYQSMFEGCTSLSYIKAMFIDSPGNSTQWWVADVAATGIFVKNSKATWDVGDASFVPTGWTVETANE